MNIDLSEPLCTYIEEELDVTTEIFEHMVCVYANTSDVLCDGSRLMSYLGCIYISDGKLCFAVGGDNPTSISNDTIALSAFDLANPKSFDKLFKRIKKLIASSAKISVIKK